MNVRWNSFKNKIPLGNNKQIKCCINFGLGLSLICSSLSTQADYAPKITNPSNGYKLNLNANSTVSTTPNPGPGGKNYYQVGYEFNINEHQVAAVGDVLCKGTVWGSQETLFARDAMHRLFIYLPSLGGDIAGRPAYKINDNMFATIVSDQGIDRAWINIAGGACSGAISTTIEPVTNFTVHFPFRVRFYIVDKTLEGQLPIPQMTLAGYVRVFTKQSPSTLPSSWPQSTTSAPIQLNAGLITVPAECTTSINGVNGYTLNLQHGVLSTINYNNTQMAKLTYKCNFTKSTSVKIRLSYTSDGQNSGVPMVDNTTGSKIYSKLELVDDDTQQTGTTLNTTIHTQKTLTVRSQLQGSSTMAGNYTGTAWIIATYN